MVASFIQFSLMYYRSGVSVFCQCSDNQTAKHVSVIIDYSNLLLSLWVLGASI